MEIRQATLPFPLDALEPHISARTIDIHYNDHHAGYVERSNRQLRGTPALPHQHLVIGAYRAADFSLFHNVAQAWNHDFYWKSLTPARCEPEGQLRRYIDRDFGSVRNLQQALLRAVTSHCGSGWVWLVIEGSTLKVTQTQNADNPQLWRQVPLLGIDTWEHAYYLDHESHVEDYASGLVHNLLNWEFAEANLLAREQTAATFDFEPVELRPGIDATLGSADPHYRAVSSQLCN